MMTPRNPQPLSGPLRLLLVGLGTCFVGVGVIGVFVPVLPTTCFILLAAACYARASQRLHRKLLANPTFGPMIRNWQEHRAISRSARRRAITLIILAFSVSLITVDLLTVRVSLVAIAVGVIVFLTRLETRDI